VLKWEGLGDILRRADAARLSRSVWLAHRLCAFTAVRIGSVIVAEWPEFHLDGETPKWIIPREKCKVKERDFDLTVVLSPTIANELRAWRTATGGTGYTFPSPAGNEHITHESLEKAYRVTLKLEGIHSPHSWRAAFSTLAKDNGFETEIVELTLDHEPRSDIARAYDRGHRLEQRVKLMHWWDAQLNAAQHGGDVLPHRPARTA
jgi:integrase